MKLLRGHLLGALTAMLLPAAASAQNITFYDTMSGANFVQWWQTQAVPACKADTKADIRYTSAGSPEVLQRIKAAGATGGDIDLLFLAPDKMAGGGEPGDALKLLGRHTALGANEVNEVAPAVADLVSDRLDPRSLRQPGQCPPDRGAWPR